MADELRLCGLGQIVDGEAAVAPCRVAETTGGDHMMQCRALAEGNGLFLASGAMHSGQPPMSGERRLSRIRNIDDRQGVIDVAVKMHRNVGVAPADHQMRCAPKPGMCRKPISRGFSGCDTSKTRRPAPKGCSVVTESASDLP